MNSTEKVTFILTVSLCFFLMIITICSDKTNKLLLKVVTEFEYVYLYKTRKYVPRMLQNVN